MNKWPLHSGLCLRMVPKTLPPFENGDTDHNPPELSVYPVSCFQTKPNIIRRAGWGFSLICGLSQDKWPSKMGTYHWEGHQVFLMHIWRVQSQVPFSGVCAHHILIFSDKPVTDLDESSFSSMTEMFFQVVLATEHLLTNISHHILITVNPR